MNEKEISSFLKKYHLTLENKICSKFERPGSVQQCPQKLQLKKIKKHPVAQFEVHAKGQLFPFL